MMDMTTYCYKPYVDPAIEGIIEKLNPPRVTIDNESYPDCTLVKVDSANKHGVLLEMVQVLTDIDLVISKSYISSDGGWLMDVFHVTDQLGNKVTDESIIRYIQEGICSMRRASKVVPPTKLGRSETGLAALEITGVDKRGLMSEISSNLASLGCHVSSAVAWTHNDRVACIIYMGDSLTGTPIADDFRLAQVQAQLECVVEAHHINNKERRSIRLAGPAAGRTHTERRLHQLMAADEDYKGCRSCCGNNSEDDKLYGYTKHNEVQKKDCYGTHVKIEYCREKGYTIVNISCRDRPKLLFDTVCTLTDLDYIVHHAGISSKRSLAFQEYYVNHKDGYGLYSEKEKRKVTQCLIAATERRVSHGSRLDVCIEDRTGLLADVTRIFRENGLSIARAEVDVHDEKAIGTFYLKDMSGNSASREYMEKVSREIVGSTIVDPVASPEPSSSRTASNGGSSPQEEEEERLRRSSFGNLLWTQLERLSVNFKPIKS